MNTLYVPTDRLFDRPADQPCPAPSTPAAIQFDAPCIRDGQPAATEIVTRYEDDGHGLPLLVILANYSVRKATYRDKDVYHVEEIPSPLGRAFLLHRQAAAVEADPDHVERYGVLVGNDQDHLCECKGHEARGRCKHVAALAALLAGGHIDEPCADRKPDAFPSPEQLAAEAGLDMPF